MMVLTRAQWGTLPEPVFTAAEKAAIAKVGRRIAELRAEGGFTQADMAEKLQIALTNYQRIEHGRQNLTIVTMVRIARALRVDVRRFFEAPVTKRAGRGRPGPGERTRV